MRAKASCPHCGEKREVEGIDQKSLPLICTSCGQIMIIDTPEQKQRNAAASKTAASVPSGPKAAGPGSAASKAQEPIPAAYSEQGQNYPTYHYPYSYPNWQRPKPKKTMRNDVTASILLYLTGVLGLLFWFSYFFVGYAYGVFEVTTDDPSSTVAFGFSIILLISSFFSILGGMFAAKKRYEMAMVSAVFGIISFGFLIGSIFSIVALVLISGNPDDFIETRK